MFWRFFSGRKRAVIILADTREPNPHPWAKYLPEGWVLERGTLGTGDLALAILPEAGVVEPKTRPTWLGVSEKAGKGSGASYGEGVTQDG